MLAKKLESAAKAVESAYIEDVFSTYLYTGNGSTQTIANNIDLSTKGGLVWIKSRTNSAGTGRHSLWDTARGRDKTIVIDTPAQDTGIGAGAGVTSFNTNGFSLGTPYYETNVNTDSVVAWTFRKQPKFFDIVTYTGDGTSDRAISHSLGSAVGAVLVKATSYGPSYWRMQHRKANRSGTGDYCMLTLNATDLANDRSTTATYFGSADPTSTVFYVSNTLNASGETYVAYLFAHNAGGFGLTGNDNVISCGSFTTDGSGNATVNLGYEPQWLLWKSSSNTSSWNLVDVTRGWTSDGNGSVILNPNSSSAEGTSSAQGVNSTGFSLIGTNANWDWIYIAIRRGPMKVPTLGTSVFQPVTYTGDGTTPRTITTGIKTDLIIGGDRDVGFGPGYTNDRLRGQANLITSDTGAETGPSVFPKFDVMNGYINLATGGAWNATSTTYIRWAFQRAPGFFDEVCYTGTGSATTQTHNLGVAPELMIVKSRSGTGNWKVWNKSSLYTNLWLNSNVATQSDSVNSPTATTFAIFNDSNTASVTYVAYLFATCAGVSKVGSYTGNGSSQTINCGFTGGARFVLIKRTDSTGDWYVWDTARGIVSGNDPHLSLNTTATEVTTDDTIDPDSTGFIVNQLAATNVNVSSATYIYLAIA